MELRHLRYLIAVAEEKSFVAAAARLSLAQPALSRQIRDLETEIGTELFVRDASGTKTTTAGEASIAAARRILDSVNAAIERARLSEHGLVGRCVIGVGRFPVWNGMLARLVEYVRKDYPGIDIVVEERALRGQWDAIANAEIDVGFGTAPPSDQMHLSVETHSLDIIDAIQVARTHPLAQRASVQLKDLVSETYIRYAPVVSSEPTRLLQAEFMARGFSPVATRHAANDDSLRMLVRAGAGWSALPHSLRNCLPHDIVAVTVDDLAVPFRYVHIHRRGENRAVVRSVVGALRRASRREGFGSMKEPDSGVKALPKDDARTGLASRVELRHLRYFTAVVEHETIGRAAEQLGITQPALSRQLRDLEEEVGATLLNRTARGVTPTLAGQSLHSDAMRILAAADQLGPEAHRAVRGAAGRCVVGVAYSPMIWDVITKAVAATAQKFPNIDVAVEDTPTPRQVAALRDARVDLAIGHRYPSLPEHDQNIARIPLLPDVMNMALLATGHPLARREDISVKELRTLPFLFMKRDFSPNFYDQVMSVFVRAGYQPKIDGEHDGLPTVWALAAQGLGWSLASASQREFPPTGLIAVRLNDFEMPWGCEVSYRQDESRPAVREVLSAIHEAARGIAMASMTSQEMKYWPQVALAG